MYAWLPLNRDLCLHFSWRCSRHLPVMLLEVNLAEQCCVLALMRTIIQTTIKFTWSGPTWAKLIKCNGDEACKILKSERENAHQYRTLPEKPAYQAQKREGRGREKTQTETENPSISLPQPLSVLITQPDYRWNPLYGHPLNIDPPFSLSLGKVLTFSLIHPLNTETDPFMRETDTFF